MVHGFISLARLSWRRSLPPITRYIPCSFERESPCVLVSSAFSDSAFSFTLSEAITTLGTFSPAASVGYTASTFFSNRDGNRGKAPASFTVVGCEIAAFLSLWLLHICLCALLGLAGNTQYQQRQNQCKMELFHVDKITCNYSNIQFNFLLQRY